MVKLTEVEDEHFSEKPATTKNDALLTNDDDDDYTDTGTSLGELYSTSTTVQCLRMRSIAREQHKPQWLGAAALKLHSNAPIFNRPKN